MPSLEDWYSRKTKNPTMRLGTVAVGMAEWKRFTGRPHYAKVSLRAEPSNSFELISEPNAWSSEVWREEFEPYVLEGVVSELLLQHPGTPVLGVRVFITSTIVDEVASNGNAFYMAARAATEQFLQGPNGQVQGNHEPSDA